DVDPAGFAAAAVSLADLVRESTKVVAKHVLFVFDSCFSGSVFNAMRGSPRYPPVINLMAASPVREFMSSGTADQTVPDTSIFRAYFVAALGGAGDLDKDGYITGTELSQFVRSKVANSSNGAQTPLFAKLPGPEYLAGDF